MLKQVFRLKPKKNDEGIKENNVKVTGVEKLGFSELVDIVFIILPYIKLIKRIRAEYQSQTDSELFRFMIQTLIEEMDKESLYQAFSIALKKPVDEIKIMPISELTLSIPKIIRTNNLLDLYLLMKRLGATDG